MGRSTDLARNESGYIGTPICVSTGGDVGLGVGWSVGTGNVGGAVGMDVGWDEGKSEGSEVGSIFDATYQNNTRIIIRRRFQICQNRNNACKHETYLLTMRRLKSCWGRSNLRATAQTTILPRSTNCYIFIK